MLKISNLTAIVQFQVGPLTFKSLRLNHLRFGLSDFLCLYVFPGGPRTANYLSIFVQLCIPLSNFVQFVSAMFQQVCQIVLNIL